MDAIENSPILITFNNQFQTMEVYRLPFEVLRAAQKSFYVRFNDGQEAFISNANFFTLMQNPDTPTMVVRTCDSQGRSTNWVVVAKMTWDLGFKTPKFDCCGNRIR